MTKEPIRKRLIASLRRLGVDHVEFRAAEGERPGWKRKEGLYATFRREIGPDNDKNLLAIPRKQRAVVRQSLDKGLEGRVDDDIDLILLAERFGESLKPIQATCHQNQRMALLGILAGELLAKATRCAGDHNPLIF